MVSPTSPPPSPWVAGIRAFGGGGCGGEVGDPLLLSGFCKYALSLGRAGRVRGLNGRMVV